jgi:hypothetical protein
MKCFKASIAVLILSSVAAGAATSSAVPTPSDMDIVEPTKPDLFIAAAPARELAAKPATPNGNPLWAIPLKQLSATRDRPIFSPSRRPPPQAVVGPLMVAVTPPAPVSQEPARPQLALLGTIVNGADGFGIFMDQANKAPLRIRIGSSYQGWTLREVKPGFVIFEKGQQTAAVAFPARPSDKGVGLQRPRPPSPGQDTASPQASEAGLRGLPVRCSTFESSSCD